MNQLIMQTLNSYENPRVKINREVVFEAFNKSNMCGNIKGKREFCLRQSWEKKLWYGNIPCNLGILAIYLYLDIRLNWLLWPQKENLNIYNFLVYQKFIIDHFEGQNWLGSWPSDEKGELTDLFSLFGSICFRVFGESRAAAFLGARKHYFFRVFTFYGNSRT